MMRSTTLPILLALGSKVLQPAVAAPTAGLLDFLLKARDAPGDDANLDTDDAAPPLANGTDAPPVNETDMKDGNNGTLLGVDVPFLPPLNTTGFNLTLDNGTVIQALPTSASLSLNQTEQGGKYAAVGRRQGPDYPAELSGREFSNIVSLGDSYSAGPGYTGKAWTPAPPVPPYKKLCRQHEGAWPVQLKERLLKPGGQFTFSACTGFDTTDIKTALDDPKTDFPKVADLVLLTMGGNNEDTFLDVIKNCAINGPGGSSGTDCAKALIRADSNIYKMDNELRSTLAAIVHKNRDAQKPTQSRTILLMGYPYLYEEGQGGGDCYTTQATRKSINQITWKLNYKLMNDAYLEGINTKNADLNTDIVFIDPNMPSPDAQIPANLDFDGKRYCNAQNSENFFQYGEKLMWNPKEFFYGFFHPSSDGFRAMAAAAQHALATKYNN
jgi:hypothetical protein